MRLFISALVASLMVAVPSAASAAPTITEYASGNGPAYTTSGPDGNVWFSETTANKIGRVTPAGAVTEYSTGLSSSAGLAGITTGPDGNLWFAESNKDRIGRITTATIPVITEFSVGITAGSAPEDITAGPDGNLWFTEQSGNRIGRITPAGTVTEFPIPGPSNNPAGITAGPDGNLWFTEHTAAGGIGRITTGASPVVTEFGPTTGQPWGITAGPDGNLWFIDTANPGAIGRISTSGVILAPFTTGLTTNGAPLEITAGADGSMYFTELAGSGELGRVTAAGVITEFTTGLSHAPAGITAGADGNIWFTEGAGNRVGRLSVTPDATTSPATGIDYADATLAGSVSPRAQATTYHFDWGLTSAYGTSTTTTSAGSGTSAVAVAAPLSGLAAAMTYHFRVVATNATGTTLGVDRTFTTAMPPPATTTQIATATTATTATLNATINPNGLATTYHFDFGPTSGYGDRSPASEAAAGSDSSPHLLSQALAGLIPATTYHYRVVAGNASGVTYGSDQSFTTASLFAPPPPPIGLPPATPPVLGQSAKISAASGTVLVELPGWSQYLSLDAASTVPVGTTIDASGGTVRLTNVRDSGGKLQTGNFWGGSFVVRQARGKHSPTVLSLAAAMSCGKSRDLSSASPPKHKVRQLWGRDNHGRFVTRGRSAVATVRGTAWFMRDTCAGTLVKVTLGSVSVHDLVKHRTLVVRAGHSYLARLQ